MARATTKEELKQASETNFDKLFALINSMTDEEQNGVFPFEDRDRNIRDVLVHLYEWYQLLLQWIKSNQSGESASFLPEPYNWRTYPQMNVELWRKHQDTSLDQSVKLLKQSHIDVMQLIEPFSGEELFAKKYFPWTGGSTLGGYCVSATSSHYDWAIKKIKKYKKSLESK